MPDTYTGLLSDIQIEQLATGTGMIRPFVNKQVRTREATAADNNLPLLPDLHHRIISYGLSSYGYDARLADTIRIFTNTDSVVIDPKNMSSDAFVERHGKGSYVIPPNSFALAHTIERFKIPEDVAVLCIGKSTYARAGLIVNVTPLEPGWEGQVTLELSNTTPLPLLVYANEGICQFMFFKAAACRTSYSKRDGKYQGQSGITLSKV